MSSIIIPSRRIRRNFKPDFPVQVASGIPQPDMLAMFRDVSAQNWFDLARDQFYGFDVAGLYGRPTRYGYGLNTSVLGSVYLNDSVLNGHDLDSDGPFTAIIVVDYQETTSGIERFNVGSGAAATGVAITASGFQYALRGSEYSGLTTVENGLQIVVMRVTDTDGQQFFRNGFLDYSASLLLTWAAFTNARYYTTAVAINSKNSLLAMGVWKRDLGSGFCRELSAEGWPMLLEPMRKAIWVPMASGGGAVDLDGAATSQATATAALAHAVPIAGAGLSVATAGGAMSLSITLAGAAQSQSAASATLTTSGSAALAGNATAQANASGGLSLTVPLSGAAVAQALAAAGITHGVPLTGAAAGQAAAGGALTLNISLSGAAISQAAASAGLTVTNASSMAAAATAQASASGALTHGVPLTGAALTVSSAGGSLTQIVPLAGSAASASMATGGLDVAVRLQADALAQALAAAGLDVQGGLSGAASGQAAADATLSLHVKLAGDAVASAIAAGALSTAGLIIDSTPGWVISSSRRSWKTSAAARQWRIAT